MKKDLRKDYPHSFTCKSTASVISPSKDEKDIARASLDSLKKLIKVSDDHLEENPDLLYLSADLWVGGMANKNDDAITVEDSIELAKQVTNKYLNLEHEEEQIIGSLLDSGFREYTDARTFIEGTPSGDQVVVSVAGFIWRSVFPELCDFIQSASDINNPNYGKASLSWEVLTKDYVILEGSKFVNKATIIDDPAEIEKRKPFLKKYGGSGTYEGKRIYRMAVGPKLFVGAGVVGNPAADVKGIHTANLKDEVEETEEIEAGTPKTKEEKLAANTQKSKKVNKKTKKLSHNKKTNVNKNNAMKYKNLEDYKKVLASLSDSEEVDVKTLADLQANFETVVEKDKASAIGDALRAEGEKFAKEKEELATAAETAKAEKEKIEAELAELKQADATKTKELEEIKAKLEAEANARVFDERMEALEKDFDLEKEDLAIVASDIKSLDEEGYTAWVAKFKVIAKEKSKEYKAKKAEEMKKLEEDKVKASADETEEEKTKRLEDEAAKILASAKETAEDQIPNSQHKAVTSLEDMFKDLKLEIA